MNNNNNNNNDNFTNVTTFILEKKESSNNINNNNNNNNNDNNNNSNGTSLTTTTQSNISAPNLRHHVFMSKETTKELSEYILPEEWGYQSGLLYKYLDYIWRCQLYDHQIKQFTFYGEDKLVFHSGLQRRYDGESVYIILVRNDAYNPFKKGIEQKWRVSFGTTIGKEIKNISFATKQDLINIWKLNENDLPLKTIFYNNISELLYNPIYGFKIDWDERLRTCKGRIFKQIGLKNNDKILSTKQLKHLFDNETRRALILAKNNPRIAVPQAFIETKNLNRGYHLELLIPLTLKLNGKKQYFALALRPYHKNKYYEGMSILTRKMAYANARLVGGIDSSWLLPTFAKSNTIIRNYTGYDDPNPHLAMFQAKLSDIPSTPSQPSNDTNSVSSYDNEHDEMVVPRLNQLNTQSNQSRHSNISGDSNHIKYNYNTLLPLPSLKTQVSFDSKSNHNNHSNKLPNINNHNSNHSINNFNFPMPSLNFSNNIPINTQLTNPIPLNFLFGAKNQSQSPMYQQHNMHVQQQQQQNQHQQHPTITQMQSQLHQMKHLQNYQFTKYNSNNNNNTNNNINNNNNPNIQQQHTQQQQQQQHNYSTYLPNLPNINDIEKKEDFK